LGVEVGRELKYRTVGVLFWVFFVLNLVATREGRTLLQGAIDSLVNDPADAAPAQALVAVVAGGLAFFTSDAVGFSLASVFYFFFWHKSRDGYSGFWEHNLSYDIKARLLTLYNNSASAGSDEGGGGNESPKERESAKEANHSTFNKRWEPGSRDSYSTEALLAYVWQYAPPYLDEWDTRRFTILHTYYGSSVGIALGWGISLVVCSVFLSLTCWHCVVMALGLMSIWLFLYNASRVRDEAWQVVDLWLASALNKGFRAAQRAFNPDPASHSPQGPAS
jgi:hypothetical protein